MTDAQVRGDRTGPVYDFRDQVALVTGGAGMGLATARAFAESGAAARAAPTPGCCADRRWWAPLGPSAV